MREFFIQITDQVIDGELTAHTTPSIINKAGIAGEHNASRLIFSLPESWGTDWEYQVECVNSTNEGTVSEPLTVSEERTVVFDIPQGMTQAGQGNYTLQAVKREGDKVISIYRSATVDVYFAKSPKLGTRIVNAIESTLLGLFAKINDIVERFNRGEFNGKDGEKGEKGDKGDKGDKGEDGVFSDELADEITLNTAARHTHANKELLDSLTESMIGTLDVYHELPQKANDGDICIYSPANVPTVEDSGKLIYVDWDIFNKTFTKEEFTQFTISFFDSSEKEVGYIYATSWENAVSGYDTTFEYSKGNEQWLVNFVGGVFDKESSVYNYGETTIYFDTPPTSFTLPEFADITSDHYNINGDVFYAPIKLMVYRDGWYEYTSAATVDVNIGKAYELPENAKDGDLILYAPQNILPECGRRIYVDWEKFKEPVNEENFSDFGITAYNSQGAETLEILCGRTSTECYFNFASMVGGSGQCILNGAFANGVTDGFSLTINDEETPIYNIDDLPKYFEIPQFDTIDTSGSTGNEYLFHTEYRLMKYQGGEWVEAVEVPEIIGDNGNLSQFIEEVSGSVNLYPPTTEGWTNSATLQSSGAIATNTKNNTYVTPQILVEPNTTYTVNDVFGWGVNTGLADKNKGRAYTANNTALADIVFTLNADESYTFTTPEGSAYIRFMGYKVGLSTNSKAPIETVIELFNNQFMLVKGTTIPSVFEPYGKGGYRLKDIEIPLKSVKLESINDKALPIFAPLAGKKIANFGDSIFGNARPPEDVSTYLAEKTGAEVLNCAFGGCRMAIHSQLGHWNAFTMVNLAQAISSGDYSVQDEALNYDDRTSYAEQPLSVIKATDFSTVDILTIAYGTNDFTSNIPLENAENPYDTTTLAGALRTSVESLLTAYPNLRIFVLSLTYRFYTDDNNEYINDSNTKTNGNNVTIPEFNAKLKEVAEEYNLPYVDDYNIGIGKFNRYQYFNVNDGAHHIETGRRLIAEHLATALSMGNNIPDSSIDKVTLSTSSAKLNANKLYDFGVATELTINFAKADPTKYNEYSFSFTSGATPTVLTLPDTVKWANELTVEANKRYEISIVDNIGLWCAVEVSE